MNISGLPILNTARVFHTSQTNFTISAAQPATEILIGTNFLTSNYVDAALIALDGNGQINGTFDSVGQTPLAPPSPAGQAAITNLVGKGWTVTTDPWQFTFDDGGGGFWDLAVDPLGNVGTTAGVAPATADVILADGFGGFWKVAVDVTGLRYTIADPGPATAAPVLYDGAGSFWQLVVDALGNLGAIRVSSLFSWTPATEIASWTDGGGPHVGNYAAFIGAADFTSLTDLTFGATGSLTALVGIQYLTALSTLDVHTNALTTLDCSTMASLTSLKCYDNASLATLNVTGCVALTYLEANFCNLAAVTGLATCTQMDSLLLTNNVWVGKLDLTPFPLLTTVDIDVNAGLTEIDMTGCTALSDIEAHNCPLLTTLTGTASVTVIGGSLYLSNCVGLNSISFPNLVIINSIYCDGCSNVTAATFNAGLIIGDSGQDIDFSGCQLNVASVDFLLARGVASGLTSVNFQLAGGTNAQPSGCGDVNTLRASGCSVNVNGPC